MPARNAAHHADLLRRIRARARPLAPRPTGIDPVLNPLGEVRAVIFDIYGTLLISASGDVGTLIEGDAGGAAAEALREGGAKGDAQAAGARAPTLMREEILASHERASAEGPCPEVDIREIWRRVLERLKAEELIGTIPDAQAVDRIAVEYESRVNPVWPMPGAIEVLASVRRSGRALGIVSNAQFYTPLMIEALFGTTPEAAGFDPALCVWSWRLRRAKPSPALFVPLVAELARRGIEPRSAVYVGNDLLNDIYAAGHAGLRTVLFAGDERSLRLREDDDRCASLRPDAVITALDQLPTLLPLP